MKSRLLTLALTLSLGIAATVAQTFGLKHYTLNVNDFKELHVENGLNVEYVCLPDSAGICAFDATDPQTGWILFDNNGKGALHIYTDVDYPYGEELPTLRVYSSHLEKVVNSGDSTVHVAALPPVDKRFKATLIGTGRLIVDHVEAPRVDASLRAGNGTVKISGTTPEAHLGVTGSGLVEASELNAPKVKASITGTGHIVCDPKEQLTVQGMGSGTVYYLSTPPSIKNRSVGIHRQLKEPNPTE